MSHFSLIELENIVWIDKSIFQILGCFFDSASLYFCKYDDRWMCFS